MAKFSIKIVVILVLFSSLNAQLLLPGMSQSNNTQESYSPSKNIKTPSVATQLFPDSLNAPQKENNEMLYPLEGAMDAKEYILGPGDKLLLSIWGGFTDEKILTVSPTGEVLIPDFGSVKISGLDFKSAKDSLAKVIKKVYKQVKYDISIIGMRKYRINLVGEIINPGLFEINQGQRLSDILIQGQPKNSADLTNILIIKDNDSTIVDLYKYYSSGDKLSNPHIKDGSTIIIPTINLNAPKIYLLSPVLSTGYYPLKENQTLNEFIQYYNAFSREVKIYSIKIYNNKKRLTLNLVDNGDLKLDDGDTLLLNSVPDSVFVTGEVAVPGAFRFMPGLSAKQYVAYAGGPKIDGSISRVIIIRDNKHYDPDDIEFIYPGDVVLVKRSSYSLLKDFLQTTGSVFSILLTAYALGIF